MFTIPSFAHRVRNNWNFLVHRVFASEVLVILEIHWFEVLVSCIVKSLEGTCGYGETISQATDL